MTTRMDTIILEAGREIPIDSFASMITGIHVKNVTICGKGVLDGRADFENWWSRPKDKIRAWRPRMIF